MFNQVLWRLKISDALNRTSTVAVVVLLYIPHAPFFVNPALAKATLATYVLEEIQELFREMQVLFIDEYKTTR